MGNNITEENYKEVVLKRSIITCWVLLALCLVIKLFGGNFFNIACEHENFIKVCEFIDNGWIYYLIAFIFYFVSTFIFYYTVGSSKKISKQTVLIISIPLIICYASKFLSTTFALILDYIAYLIVSIILCKKSNFNRKQTIIRIVLGFILNNAFQLISLFIKNFGLFDIMDNNTLLQIIFSIDYYIMLVLYMLYSIKITNKEK